jgi:hypothetical protein
VEELVPSAGRKSNRRTRRAGAGRGVHPDAQRRAKLLLDMS